MAGALREVAAKPWDLARLRAVFPKRPGTGQRGSRLLPLPDRALPGSPPSRSRSDKPQARLVTGTKVENSGEEYRFLN